MKVGPQTAEHFFPTARSVMRDHPGEPSPPFDVSAAQLIDAVCDRFEDSWRAGQRPSVAAFLAQASEPVRPALLRELLRLDLDYRSRVGERPVPEDYLAQFPEQAERILTAFREFFPARDQPTQAAPPRDPPATAGPLPPLERLGDYRIIREIGHGGMGVVYEAEQLSLGRHVALKILPQKLLEDPGTRARFEREARAAAKLHHTNIVPVFGVGEHDGQPYYAMQFIQGLGLDLV